MSLDDEVSTDSILYQHSTGEEYKVTLLITRHGLSCPNIIEKWGGMGGKDFARGFIKDPPIAGAAQSHAVQSGAKAKQWLLTHQLELDAVVTSVLARAIETGLLTYDQVPLYVVPYIREHAGGLSNQERVGIGPDKQVRRDAQIAELEKTLGRVVDVNYDFADEDIKGCKEHDWTKFLTFMARRFLPELIDRGLKNQDNKIVVAVVTHSRFVSEIAEVQQSCGGHWEAKNAVKPLNNMILAIPYLWMKGDTPVQNQPLSRLDSWDTTGCQQCLSDSHEQQGSRNCLQVFEGFSEYEEAEDGEGGHGPLRPLCMADIGNSCYTKTKWFSFTGRFTVLSNLLEVPIVDVAKKLYKEHRSKSAQGLLTMSSIYIRKRKRATKGGQEELPESFIEFCYTRGASERKCKNVQRLIGDIEDLYKQGKCFNGKKPNMWEFKNFRGIDWGPWQVLMRLKQLEVLPADAFEGMPDDQRMPEDDQAQIPFTEEARNTRVGEVTRHKHDAMNMAMDETDTLPLLDREDELRDDSKV
jgi:hypothetical protein